MEVRWNNGALPTASCSFFLCIMSMQLFNVSTHINFSFGHVTTRCGFVHLTPPRRSVWNTWNAWPRSIAAWRWSLVSQVPPALTGPVTARHLKRQLGQGHKRRVRFVHGRNTLKSRPNVGESDRFIYCNVLSHKCHIAKCLSNGGREFEHQQMSLNLL